jgi:hypothetical protein
VDLATSKKAVLWWRSASAALIVKGKQRPPFIYVIDVCEQINGSSALLGHCQGGSDNRQSQSNDGKMLRGAQEAIEQAIERLTAVEREALESRLLTRRFGLEALDDQERTELLASLDTSGARH